MPKRWPDCNEINDKKGSGQIIGSYSGLGANTPEKEPNHTAPAFLYSIQILNNFIGQITNGWIFSYISN